MIPGSVLEITLTRNGRNGHAADGTPLVLRSIVWKKRGHFQPIRISGSDYQQNPTGPTYIQIYRFWIPYVTGTDRPRNGDTITVLDESYQVDSIDYEAFRHHLIVRGRKVTR
jgi:hypothetical protein